MAIITVSISDNQREDMKDHLEPGQSMSGLIRNLITDWIDRKTMPRSTSAPYGHVSAIIKPTHPTI